MLTNELMSSFYVPFLFYKLKYIIDPNLLCLLKYPILQLTIENFDHSRLQ